MLINKNLQIEGLRGVAILLVVIYHVFCRYRQIYLDDTIEWMEYFGASAVNLFFLMSGYFFWEKTKFTKKIIRLWPSYVVGVVFSIVLLEIFLYQKYLLSFVFVGSALLFVLCVKKRLNFLESRIFAFFGLISYPLYIIHQNLVYVIEYYLSPMIGFYCAAIISFFVSIVAGMVLFYLVERKSQEFLGRTKNA